MDVGARAAISQPVVQQRAFSYRIVFRAVAGRCPLRWREARHVYLSLPPSLCLSLPVRSTPTSRALVFLGEGVIRHLHSDRTLNSVA